MAPIRPAPTAGPGPNRDRPRAGLPREKLQQHRIHLCVAGFEHPVGGAVDLDVLGLGKLFGELTTGRIDRQDVVCRAG